MPSSKRRLRRKHPERWILLDGDDQLFPLDQFVMSYEITINLSIAISDASYFSPRILFKNGESLVLQLHDRLVKQRHGNDVVFVGRRIGIGADGIEDIPWLRSPT